MKVLVLNCGSSSVKFRLFQTDKDELLAGGLIERIGSPNAGFVYRPVGKKEIKETKAIKDYEQAIDLIIKTLCHPEFGKLGDIQEIDALGHRVVHGGEEFTESVLISEAVLQRIKECVRLAPLHNPPNIKGIQASLWLIPFAHQIAVFDTAFHETMKPPAYIYALPYEWYEKRRIRRYGFHGTSHRYVASGAAKILGKSLEDLKIVTCHLGNGVSITAVAGGKSMDTSMGFTPLEGMVMGTRCGDIDPAIPLHIMETDSLTPAQMDSLLNKKSGLLGITGGDNDMRTIEEKAAAGSERHGLALRIFTQRVKKYIGAYAAVMGGLDAIVFTAGIGENSPTIRKMACEGLEFLGVDIDAAKNEKNQTNISRGRTPVLIVPTNEELAIAQEVVSVLEIHNKRVEA